MLAVVANRLTRAPAAPSPGAPFSVASVPFAAPVAAPPSGPEVVPGPDDDLVEHSRARRVTAEHMVRSLHTSAHTLVGGGSVVRGTIDPVGADHLDVAEHDEDVPRRAENVTGQTTVPCAALVAVESRP